MKKKETKYQQYFNCFICLHISSISILVLLLLEYGTYSNKRHRGALLIRREALIRGRCLYQCGYKRCGTYLGAALIRENTVLLVISSSLS